MKNNQSLMKDLLTRGKDICRRVYKLSSEYHTWWRSLAYLFLIHLGTITQSNNINLFQVHLFLCRLVSAVLIQPQHDSCDSDWQKIQAQSTALHNHHNRKEKEACAGESTYKNKSTKISNTKSRSNLNGYYFSTTGYVACKEFFVCY